MTAGSKRPALPTQQSALTRVRSTAARLGPVLTASLRGDRPSPLEDDLSALLHSQRVATELPALAAYHRIGPWVQGALAAQPALPPHVAVELRSLCDDSMAMHLLALGSLAKLAAPLDSLGCRWLVFKGPVLAKLVYQRPDLRSYSDLDVLVERKRLGDAVAILEDVGFNLVDANWALIASSGAGQVHLEHGAGGGVDLHWHVLFDRSTRAVFRIPVDEMVERSRRVELNGIPIHTFDAADTLLHLCLHAALEGADRLIWLKDVEQVARHSVSDWDELVTRATSWRIQLPVAVVLARASRTVGAPVPTGVLEALAPGRTWRWVSDGIDRLFPAASSHGRGNPATLLARSTRSDWRSTILRFTSGLAERLRRLVVARSWQRDRSQWDPGSPGSLLYRSDEGENDRAAYFDWVRNHDD